MNMMNKTYIHFVLILCMAFFSGCVNVEEFEEPAQKVTKIFYADMENQPGTKTVLGEKDAEGFRTIFWMPEDSIGVAPINTSESSFDCFVNQKTELSNRAVFEGKTAVAQEYVAVYPYDWGTSILDKSVYLTLDPVQTYVEGTFEQGAFPMLARTSDTDEGFLKFLNLCGILEINLKGEEKIESITFSSDNNVSGLFSVDLDYELYPALQSAGSNTHKVKLDCGDGVQLDASSPTSFYLVLPPAEYQSFCLVVRTVDGKRMLKQSKNPLTITRSRLTATGTLTYVESMSIDLSESGTSNCYMVSQAGSYMFDASVKGNSNEPVGEYVDVEVLWETKGLTKAEVGEIITDVQLSGDYVMFESTGIEGNALIAAKDADGKVIWSWHIWVTDTPKDQFYYNGTGTFFVQDRNLGAIRADKGTGDGEWKESFGMYYQWGRKDPFVAGLYTIGDKKIALATSIAEPTVFPATDSHWLISDDYELWNSSEKTIYDPCPPGYIIGSSDLWNSLRYQQIENVDNGWELMIDNVYRTWIPASSWIDVYGSPMNYNDEVYLWSGTYNKSLHIYNQSVQVSSWRLNNGFAVRCMSEKGPSANLQTDYVTEVTKTSAVLNGSIEYLQDVIISEMGFLWSTSKEFIDANTLKVHVCEGKFSATLNNLKLGTTYYVRTYAIDNGRTVYGTSQNFMLQNADTGEDIPEGDEYEW